MERERDAESLLPLVRRQSFNWLPTAPGANTDQPYYPRQLEMLSRMDNGLTITGFLADDKKSVVLGFSWDAEHLSLGEASAALDQLSRFVEFMGQSSNWTVSCDELLRM